MKHLAINGVIEYRDWAWIVALLTNNGGRLETFLAEVCSTLAIVYSSNSHLERNKSHPCPRSVLAFVPKITTCDGGRVPYPTTKRESKELNVIESSMSPGSANPPVRGLEYRLLFSLNFFTSSLTHTSRSTKDIYVHYDYPSYEIIGEWDYIKQPS